LKSSGYRQLHIRRDARPQGVIAYATIENAGKLNAINSALMGELVEGMGELADDDRLRAVVLTGAGPKAFIAGVDINEMARIENGAQATAFITRLHQCCAAIRDMPVPVIARIQGYVFGAGVEVAAACDMRVAASDAQFGMPEVRLGVPSVVEAALLPQLIGWGRTRQWLLTGDTIDAATALAWGLIEQVVPAERLDDAVERLLASVLASGPHALRLQKALITAWEDLPLREAIQRGIASFASAWASDEPRSMMQRFLAGRRRRKRSSPE
jgi:enoyl-CoA hydratase/carnithine racemase